MLEIRNHTPLSATFIPGLDKHGMDYAAVIMKGKFIIQPGQTRLVFSDDPVPLFETDEHYGEPDKTSVRYESDAVVYKRGTDVVVNGNVYAPNQQKAYQVDVSVQVKNRIKSCRVFGDRVWEKSSKIRNSWVQSQAQPFERLPMVYENAFGGIDNTNLQNGVPDFYASNPVGKGFIATHAKSPQEGTPLPNIEDLNHLIQHWDQRPPPAGFGFIGRSWQPRIALAGTYDDDWKKSRLPLLPQDFDDHYFNGAHPDLVMDTYLQGGESITLTNLSQSGRLTFEVPSWNDTVKLYIKNTEKTLRPVLDTIIIEPDTNTVLVTWRATTPCDRQFLYLDTVIIGQKKFS